MKNRDNKIIDIHAHILPGVDDGAKTLEEALGTLMEAQRQGIESIIVTPHYHPGRYIVTPAQIREKLALLRSECKKRNIRVELYPGQECCYYSGLPEELLKGNVLTMAGSRYVLVEFEPDCLYSYLAGGLRELQSCGYQPILAHFERYQCLHEQKRLYDLKEQGVFLQMNFDTLLLGGTIFFRNPWRRVIEDGLVDYLGSDCHGTHFRPLQVQKALRRLSIWADSDFMEEMLYGRAADLLKSNGSIGKEQ
jgi:protein-tyrosine phosphatase